jgi:hypothetical protein
MTYPDEEKVTMPPVERVIDSLRWAIGYIEAHNKPDGGSFEDWSEFASATDWINHADAAMASHPTPDGPASPVLPDDDHPVLLALREAVCEELDSWGYRDEEGEALFADGCEAIAEAIAAKVKPLLGASPLLGDEERERLMNIAHGLLGQGYHEDPADAAAFLRKLAQGEERDG